MAKRSYSYAFLTMGGRRFVELTPERVERLYPREQLAIKRHYELTGERITDLTKEDIMEGGIDVESLLEVTRGERVEEIEDIVANNYAAGLESMNRLDLANRFKNLYADLQEFGGQYMLDAFMHEIPDLYLIYKDTGKSHVKRQSTFNQTTARDQTDLMKTIIDKYERMLLDVMK